MFEAPLFQDKPSNDKTQTPHHEDHAHGPSNEEREDESKVHSVQIPNNRNTLNAVAVLESDYIGSLNIETGVNNYRHGKYDKALQEFNRALEAQHVSVGENDITVALTLGNLGATYLQTGDYIQAECMLEESLALKVKLSSNLLLADTLNNLGSCAIMRGDFKTSLNYYRRALDDLRMNCGPNSLIVDALFNIGRLEIQQNHLDVAREALNEAWRRSKAPQILDLIGLVQLRTGDVDGAMISFTKSLAINRKLFGPVHLDVANSLFNVSMVRKARGEWQDAWESFTTTRDLYSCLMVSSDHPRYKTTIDSIAQVEAIVFRETKANKKQNRSSQF
jgi:tetratricopeptide (TPR) repeat protein